MWINAHDGSLVNVEKLDFIFCKVIEERFKVVALNNDVHDVHIVLGAYRTRQDAEQALGEIYSNLKDDAHAMRMPEYNW